MTKVTKNPLSPDQIPLDLINEVRKQNPLIHNITNLVSANFTANGLLAVGASPMMAESPLEMAELAKISSASKNTHGTGCTFSACITAELAKGASVADAIHTAKRLISQAIRPSPTSDTDMGRSIIGRFGKAGYR